MIPFQWHCRPFSILHTSRSSRLQHFIILQWYKYRNSQASQWLIAFCSKSLHTFVAFKQSIYFLSKFFSIKESYFDWSGFIYNRKMPRVSSSRNHGSATSKKGKSKGSSSSRDFTTRGSEYSSTSVRSGDSRGTSSQRARGSTSSSYVSSRHLSASPQNPSHSSLSSRCDRLQRDILDLEKRAIENHRLVMFSDPSLRGGRSSGSRSAKPTSSNPSKKTRKKNDGDFDQDFFDGLEPLDLGIPFDLWKCIWFHPLLCALVELISVMNAMNVPESLFLLSWTIRLLFSVLHSTSGIKKNGKSPSLLTALERSLQLFEFLAYLCPCLKFE